MHLGSLTRLALTDHMSIFVKGIRSQLPIRQKPKYIAIPICQSKATLAIIPQNAPELVCCVRYAVLQTHELRENAANAQVMIGKMVTAVAVAGLRMQFIIPGRKEPTRHSSEYHRQ